MKFVKTALICTVLASSIGFAQAKLSADFNKCMNDSNGVTAYMLSCIGDENEKQDVLLNKYYKQYMKQASKHEKSALKKAQIAWIKWRDAETSFASSSEGGTLSSVIAADRFLTITAERVDFLAKLLGVEANAEASQGANDYIGRYISKRQGADISFVLGYDPQGTLRLKLSGIVGSSTCDLNAVCSLIDSGVSCLDPDNEAQEAVNIVFKGRKAKVDSNTPGASCGIQGYITGTYVKE